jgi:hypothetical protein
MDSWHGNDGENFFFFDTSKSYEIAGRVGWPAGGWFFMSLFNPFTERMERERERIASLFCMYSLESRVLYFPGAAEVLMGMKA